MPNNNNKFEVMTRARFHVFFMIYLDIINKNSGWINATNGYKEKAFPIQSFYYGACNTEGKIRDITEEIILDNNTLPNGETNKHTCSMFYNLADKIRVQIADIDMFKKYVENYLNSVRNAAELLPNAEEGKKEAAFYLKPKEQRNEIIKKIKENYGELLITMLYGGSGKNTHKRFCVEEFLLILLQDELISLSYGGFKDVYDDEFNCFVFYPILTTRYIGIIKHGDWEFDIDNAQIIYKNTTLIEITNKKGLILELGVLAILIENRGQGISPDKLKIELTRLSNGKLFTTPIRNLIDKMKNQIIKLHIDIDAYESFDNNEHYVLKPRLNQ